MLFLCEGLSFSSVRWEAVFRFCLFSHSSLLEDSDGYKRQNNGRTEKLFVCPQWDPPSPRHFPFGAVPRFRCFSPSPEGMPFSDRPRPFPQQSVTRASLFFPVQFPNSLHALLLLSVLFFGVPKFLEGLAPSQKERQRQMRIGFENDPNVQFQCRGALGEFAACLCNDKSNEIACINAQFVDNAVFHYLNGHYDSVEQLTFHGNNFQELPEGPLFGSHSLDRLRVLNISANYIVNLHRNALRGAPNIEVLDLSNNEIVLSEENVNFLSHSPRLRKLFLRRAFTSPHNRIVQFALMLKLFEKADLRRLELLDLSYNFFTSVPSQLPCPFPSLRHLDLRQNLLESLSLNVSCLAHIGSINLERNSFHSLDTQFRTFATELASHSPLAQLLLRNSFYCDCSSAQWVQWLRQHSAMVIDYRFLICSRASPQKYSGSRLSEVPLAHLDCQMDLVSSARAVLLPFLPSVASLFLSVRALLRSPMAFLWMDAFDH
ncbi:hypothetical protein niasHT_001559 [Heterodera trifolii]|uniref:Leucine Rich repeat-containing domain protein n=1 Tax=Heterodera trifolii TaxID=157864 RepID=A0ABD2MCF5_9BILA